MLEPAIVKMYTHRMHNLTASRKQLPVVLTEAMTTHKSQDGAYKSVVVYDIGKNRTIRSLIHIAYSRATCAERLVLVCKNNLFIAPKSTDTDKTKSTLFKELQCNAQDNIDTMISNGIS